ncbi:MAG TPA: gluconokinase [Euzebyales bacterium]
MTRTVIGLDVGTTAVKAGLYDADGHELGVARQRHPLRSSGGEAEQDPGAVVDATIEALTQAVATARQKNLDVAGISVSTAMHGVIGLDRDRRPVTPLVTWGDTRAHAQAAALRAGHLDVYRRTGTPLHPMAPLAKLRWYHEERAALAADVRTWVTAKELVLDALTGVLVIDRSSASATGLYALKDEAWDAEALSLAHTDADHLAPVVPTDHLLDALTADVAERTGLPRGTPVVAGATDGVLANLGVAAVGNGVGAVTIGTSGAVRTVVGTPHTDPRMRTYCYALADHRWVVGGAISNGGLWLRWLRDAGLVGDLDDAALSELASEVPPASHGVTVLPYLTGERAPQWSSTPSGVVFGLRLGHGRGHLVRAGMEGVAHQLRLVADALADGGYPLRRLRATGGFTRSPVWLRIVAGVLDVPIEVPAVTEATAFGAAILGMAALGLVDDLDVATDMVTVASTHQPDDRDAYAAAHRRYAELVDVLGEPFDRLASERPATGG